ncbi:MAG TPA: NADH-quinone oxidoreductase subunit NuoG [Acidimicrobiia bacterium]|nr:NADH-quinone oxidoreductase subunit NuoG [Acidimicrobiia bacterium]
MGQTVSITIDGVEHRVAAGSLLIRAAQDTGTYIPRFCWHERMKPVGMCRMCLVEVEGPRGPMLVTACTNEVVDGMVVDTGNATVRKAQEGVLEFLLANHPLDCPVCDKGGECPLQDQAFSHGPGESRFVEIKRNYEKPIAISSLVLLDRERCILCARCTRFSEEISGDPLIEFKARANITEVNTFPDHPFASYFSGNTIQICPVGALTSVQYRFRARPWDLQMVESSGLHDTAHPRVSVHASQNQILRLVGVDNDATNHGWLSDKERFGFEYLGSEERLTAPLVRKDGRLIEVDWAEALELVAERIGRIRDEHGGESFAVIGGAHGTNEDAYALAKFARVVLGTNNVDARLDDTLASHFLAATVDRARIADIDTADTILVWGPDLKEEHPTLYLRVRMAAQELGVRLVVVHPRATGLDDRATIKVEYRPGAGFALLDEIAEGRHPELSEALSAERVVVFAGQASFADGPRLAEAVAAYVRSKAGSTRILPLARRGNLFGALDMGLAPDLLPGRVGDDEAGRAALAEAWGEIPAARGQDTKGMLGGLASGEIRFLLLVGSDPVRDLPDPRPALPALEGAESVVSIDLFLNDSNREADVIFPAAGFTEKEGTVTNLEGRVQKVNMLAPGPGQTRPDWAILADLADRAGRSIGLSSADTIAKEISDLAPVYAGITWDHLEWEARDGAVVPLSGVSPLTHIPVSLKGDIAPSAELTLHVGRTLYDDGVMMRHSPNLHPLAPGPLAHLNPEDAKRAGALHGHTVRVVTKHGEGEFSAVLDEGTPPGVVYVPFNQPGAAPLGTDAVVRVTTVGR